jgi:hypothetical protein
MLLLLLRWGNCGDALKAVREVFGPLEGGPPEYIIGNGDLMVFCHEDEFDEHALDARCPASYLVIRYNTSKITGGDPDYYDWQAVTPEMVLERRQQICALLERLRGAYYLAVATTQPYIEGVLGIYFGESPPPVYALGVEIGDEGCGRRLYEALAVAPRVTVATPQGGLEVAAVEAVELVGVSTVPPPKRICEK